MILSKFPIIKSDCISFNSYASYDSIMEKGCIYAKIKVSHNLKPIHIFNSHLQSSYSKEKTWETKRPAGRFRSSAGSAESAVGNAAP